MSCSPCCTDGEHALRRALSDPSKPADEKGAIAVALLHGKVAPVTEQLVAAIVRSRWAGFGGPHRRGGAARRQRIRRRGAGDHQLDDLEDELFRFGRMVAGEPDLRVALSDPVLPADRKRDLLTALLQGKVTPVTLRLLTEMAVYPRGRSRW